MHTDHLNTPRKISQPSTGTLAWRYDADPFGTAAPNQNPGGLGTFVYNLRAPGQYYMAETGLNQNWNRDYDPLGGGRYIESDPIGLFGGVNTYAYLQNDPIGLVDPNGLQSIIACANPVNAAVCAEAGIIVAPGATTTGSSAAAVASSAAATAGALAASGDTTKTQCPTGDPDRCAQAIADAESAYSNLVSKRIPQYTESDTPDVGHYDAILERQRALKDAIRRVKLWCRPLPPQLPEWERVANLPIIPRH